jgi:hypothetical protein
MQLDDMARYADNILLLGEGGSFAGFESAADWISRNPLANDALEDTDSEEPTKEERAVFNKTKAVEEEEDPDELVKRQVGDASVWWYYGKTAGLSPVLLLIIFTAISTMGSYFPRELLALCRVFYGKG